LSFLLLRVITVTSLLAYKLCNLYKHGYWSVCGMFIRFIGESGEWLRHYATRHKVAGSGPDEVNGFLSVYLILPAALDPGICWTSDSNEYQRKIKNVYGEQSADGMWGWQLHHHMWADCLDNVGSSRSHKPRGLEGMLREKL
jgi:hypothetical protein